MEPKRDLASIDIAAVVHELDDLDGAFFDKAYLYPDAGLLRLKLRHHDHGRIELLASVGESMWIYRGDSERVPDAPSRPPNFAKMLRNRLEGGRLDELEQVGFDRIVRIDFDVPDGTVSIYVELFGDGNIAVVGTDGDIVDCLRSVRLRSRTVLPGKPYEPPTQRVNPFDIDRDEFDAIMAESDTDLVRTVATQLNLGGRYAEELCTRAEVEKTLDISEAGSEAYDGLFEALRGLKSQLYAGEFTPTVYEDDSGVVDVSPFDLVELESLETTSFETVSAAIESYFTRLPERETVDTDSDDEQSELEEERARLNRIIEHQERTIGEYREEATALREQAEMLYANYELVDEVISTISNARASGHGWEAIDDRLQALADDGIEAAQAVTGIDGESARVGLDLSGQTVWVEVDEGVEHNADRLYREAKAVEEKIEGAKEAMAETEDELDELENLEPQPTDTLPETPTDWLSMRSIPIRQPDHWFERFRWFHTSDGYLVIGGRNAKQNEELIKKYAEPYDRVFHTQAHGGPVTLLKATDPSEAGREVEFPETSLEQAAQFAVSYSSVWKDGHFAGDVYLVSPEQLTKEAESGESVAAGGFVVRGEREYFDDTPVGVAVGISCEPETRVIGGPPAAIDDQVVTTISVEPGRFAQADVAKRIYRRFRDRFTDETFVRKVASPDQIQHFLPPGTSRMLEE